MAAKCENCKFYDDMNERCRRYPPAVIKHAPNQNRWTGGQPYVSKHSWCGEHKAKGLLG